MKILTETPIVDEIVSGFSEPNDAMVPVDVARKLERELNAAKSELEAWHSQFGTSQLSHAVAVADDLKARLSAADKANEWQSKVIELAEELMPESQQRKQYLRRKWEMKP